MLTFPPPVFIFNSLPQGLFRFLRTSVLLVKLSKWCRKTCQCVTGPTKLITNHDTNEGKNSQAAVFYIRMTEEMNFTTSNNCIVDWPDWSVSKRKSTSKKRTKV